MPLKLPPLGPKTLRLTRKAEADLDDIVNYIEDEAGTAVALKFADRLDAELQKLALLGHGGVSREHVSPGLRAMIFGNYCFYFRLTDNETIILRVLHSARDIEKIEFGRCLRGRQAPWPSVARGGEAARGYRGMTGVAVRRNVRKSLRRKKGAAHPRPVTNLYVRI